MPFLRFLNMEEVKCANGAVLHYDIYKRNTLDEMLDGEIKPKVEQLATVMSKDKDITDGEKKEFIGEVLGGHMFYLYHDSGHGYMWKVAIAATALKADAQAISKYFQEKYPKKDTLINSFDNLAVAADKMMHLLSVHAPKDDDGFESAFAVLQKQGLDPAKIPALEHAEAEVNQFKKTTRPCSCGVEWKEWEVGRELVRIILPDFYKTHIKDGHALLRLREPEPNGWSTAVAIGKDNRAVRAIYEELKPIVESASSEQFTKSEDLQKIDFLVGKYLETPKAGEELKPEYAEQIKLTNKTVIDIEAWGPHAKGLDEKATKQIQAIVYKPLLAHGYEIIQMHRSCSFSHDHGVSIVSFDLAPELQVYLCEWVRQESQ